MNISAGARKGLGGMTTIAEELFMKAYRPEIQDFRPQLRRRITPAAKPEKAAGDAKKT